jgi:hypothetical protein
MPFVMVRYDTPLELRERFIRVFNKRFTATRYILQRFHIVNSQIYYLSALFRAVSTYLGELFGKRQRLSDYFRGQEGMYVNHVFKKGVTASVVSSFTGEALGSVNRYVNCIEVQDYFTYLLDSF